LKVTILVFVTRDLAFYFTVVGKEGQAWVRPIVSGADAKREYGRVVDIPPGLHGI
jgi:hypothetical protein